MASNGLDRQIKFLHTFFPIKYLNFFASVVYLNLFLINIVVPPGIYFCLSSVSRLNSSTFLHFNLVNFFEFHFPLKQSLFCLLSVLFLCSCEFLIRVFFRHHHHPPPLQQTPNQRPPNLLN